MDVGLDEVRYAYLQLLDTIHFIADPLMSPEEGYPHLVEDLRPPRRPGLVSPGWRSMEAPSSSHLRWDCLPHRVAIKDGRLATWVARDAANYRAPRVVDADHLEYALRDSYGGYRLVDRSGRQVTVNPKFFKRGRSLRRRLDDLLAGVPVLSCDFDAWYRHYMNAGEQRLERERRQRVVRRAVFLVPLLLVGGYGFSYWLRRRWSGHSRPAHRCLDPSALSLAASLRGGRWLVPHLENESSRTPHGCRDRAL